MDFSSLVKRTLGRFTGPDESSPEFQRKHLSAHYREIATAFHDNLREDLKPIFIEYAVYHQKRYLDRLSVPLGERLLELGSDKPFISHFLRTLNPGTEVATVSIDIPPNSPYPITRIDIESEVFPFEPGSMSDVIFAEVLEHLFRDPAWTVYQINRVLKIGGKLFLTTPNACGYDVLVNLLSQVPPNGRNQVYASIESGHPHLWTAEECRLLLEAHGFAVTQLATVDYYEFPFPPAVKSFLAAHSVAPDLNGQVLRIVAEKQRDVEGPAYVPSLFPQLGPVKLQGALLEWARKELQK